MQTISFKKIIIAILIVVLLSRLDRVLTLISHIYETIDESFDPLRNCSEGARYLVTLALLSLAFVIFWQLYLRKK